MTSNKVIISQKLVKANYTIFEFFWTCFCYLWTKLFFRGCSLVRLPIVLRGKKNIIFGKGFKCGYHNRIEVYTDFGKILFGKNIQINDFCHFSALTHIEIGDNTLIASKVFITDHNHGLTSVESVSKIPLSATVTPPIQRDYVSSSVIIGKNVWIGEGVVILPGVVIGDNCVVGASSVVTRSLRSSTLCVGIPAVPIKEI